MDDMGNDIISFARLGDLDQRFVLVVKSLILISCVFDCLKTASCRLSGVYHFV